MPYTNKGFTLGILIALAIPAMAVTTVTCANATIAAPGVYQLKSNLACTVSITSSGVALKLNGWTITPASGDGIDINFPIVGRLNHVTVQGPGLISGLNGNVIGINIQNTDYSLIEQVTILGQLLDNAITARTDTFLTVTSNVTSGGLNGIGSYFCASCVFSSNDTSGNASNGIFITLGSNNTVNNNRANGNAFSGINIFTENGARIYGNITNGNAQDGILVIGPGVQVFSNISSQANGTNDMFDTSSTCNGDYWSNNVFQTANQTCIH